MTTLMDAVASATSALPRLYPLGSVPPNPGYPYGSYAVQFTRDDAYTLDGGGGVRWVRITAQFFGRTEDSTLDLSERFLSVLRGLVLTTADGITTTPLRIELDPTPPTRDPDAGGVIGVTTTLTATAN